jgi:peptide/nickel transport system substrate-binding protein
MAKLKDLELLLSNGRITRREFMARASALGVMAAVSPALLTGEAKAAKPKKGGRLRIAASGGSTTDSLDPGTLTSTHNQLVNFQVRNCLAEVDHNYNLIPELAESWEASPDAVKWTFKLHKGIEFHNGKTMEAEDVIDSINHHRGKDEKKRGEMYAEMQRIVRDEAATAIPMFADIVVAASDKLSIYLLKSHHVCKGFI